MSSDHSPGREGRPRAQPRPCSTSTRAGSTASTTPRPATCCQYWESPDVDFEQDILVAENDDGTRRLRGRRAPRRARLARRSRDSTTSRSATCCRPIEKVAAAKKPDAGLMAFTSEDDEPLRDLLSRSGYEVVRHSYRMRDRARQRAPRARVARRLHRPTRCARARSVGCTTRTTPRSPTRGCSQPEPYELWRHWFIEDPAFDPSLWFLAEHGDEVAGIAIARACRVRAGPRVGPHPRGPAGVPAARARPGAPSAHVRRVREPRLRRGGPRRRRREPDRRRARLRARGNARRAHEPALPEVRDNREAVAEPRIDVSIEHKNRRRAAGRRAQAPEHVPVLRLALPRRRAEGEPLPLPAVRPPLPGRARDRIAQLVDERHVRRRRRPTCAPRIRSASSTSGPIPSGSPKRRSRRASATRS